MKNSFSKIALGSLILATVLSCNKHETAGYSPEKANSQDYAELVSDSISSVATMKVKDKQFIKSADVNMEVKDVYDATISIEKSLKDLGGFVTSSRLNSRITSEDTFKTSDENSSLVRKFQTENAMQVRIPSEKLGEFLTLINDKKVFLNSRIINAEDVTNNAKVAEPETKKLQKTGQVIEKMKNNGEKVEKIEKNLSQNNERQIATLNLGQLKIQHRKHLHQRTETSNSRNCRYQYKKHRQQIQIQFFLQYEKCVCGRVLSDSKINCYWFQFDQ